ncbi:P-loop containing nucleoside triphosphate hydrolase protein [Apiosordaria backusii]|uniref:Cell division control protein n=1 Tax=Apiosordaria backusii TaxID=314023 RepID=A0AA40EZ03_9PEZI|nr:P-loop containing nucleoside triphosphate hydrolase protein [Apiosordaria backusii]
MVSPTLGKRTRSSRGTSESAITFELPAKRTRRTVRSATIVEEPEAEKENNIVIAEDDDENNETSETQEKATTWREKNLKEVQKTPSKSLARRASVASTVKSSAIPPVTPSTPRHYDVFSKGVTTTPRHRVMSVGKFSKRMTPSTPLTPSSVPTVYHQARQLFSRSADPGELIGRDDERAQMKKFLSRCTTSKPSGCLYVSGPPGTGKSAMVNRITETVSESSDSHVKKAYINCMSIKSSKDLYFTLLDQLITPDDQEADLSETDVVEALQKLFVPKKKSPSSKVYLIVLDEIDHILTLDPESLYRVFEWSLQPTGSRLLMVGIANALDLTDRFLPRLKSRNLKPEILPFLPYTAPQVKNIITTRLKSLLPPNHHDKNFIPFFHPAAIELCSRKVSTQTGDLRRAFEVCRRAIDLVESETRLKHENEIKENLLQMSPSRKVLGEKHNLSTPKVAGPSQSVSGALIKSLQSLTVETAPRVSIGHLNKVTAAAFSNGTAQRLKVLNLQQKAALCSLLAIEKRNRDNLSTPSKNQPSAPTVKNLFESYTHLCKTDSVLHPLSSSEFREVISSLETLSLIAEVDGKTGSLSFNGSVTPGGLARTPSRGGRKKKDVFGMGDMRGGLMADERRVASCVGFREMEGVVEGDGKGAGILGRILGGEGLDY